MTFLRNFWKDEQGQDLIEYTLLMAFVALASAALFLGAGNSIKGIWTTTNSQLVAANTRRQLGTREGHAGRWRSLAGVPGSGSAGLRNGKGGATDGRNAPDRRMSRGALRTGHASR